MKGAVFCAFHLSIEEQGVDVRRTGEGPDSRSLHAEDNNP
jgi:hypothetical protein